MKSFKSYLNEVDAKVFTTNDLPEEMQRVFS